MSWPAAAFSSLTAARFIFGCLSSGVISRIAPYQGLSTLQCLSSCPALTPSSVSPKPGPWHRCAAGFGVLEQGPWCRKENKGRTSPAAHKGEQPGHPANGFDS